MLESLAASLLNRLLGSYIENFNPTQLNLGIWSGDVKLKNLELKKDCLDALDLPINVEMGVLGQLSMNVPWSSLKNKPVKIVIEDCFMIVVPNDKFYEFTDLNERQLKLKLKRLLEWELHNSENTNKKVVSKNYANNDDVTQIPNSSNESFLQSLITKVIDNLQIVIKNIHIRFEDVEGKLCNYNSSIGFQLKELSAVSTNDKWIPSFIEISGNLTHKLMKLEELAIYWNSDNCKSLLLDSQQSDWDAFIQTLKKDMELKNSKEYILSPVNTLGKLVINKSGTTEKLPHINLELSCDNFGIKLNDYQYLDLLTFISNTHIQRQSAKYKVNRPKMTIQEDPKSWFKYFGQCTLYEIHEKNKKWSWNQIKLRCEQRRRYIALWKQKLNTKSTELPLPSEDDEKEFNELQKDLPFEMITLFRMIAQTEHAKEKIASREQSQEVRDADHTETTETGKNSSWLSSWWSTNKTSNNTTLTDEQKQELYAIIEYNENEIKSSSNIMLKNNIPRHWTEWVLGGFLRNGSFILQNRNSGDYKIAEIKFNDCLLNINKRPDSFLLNFKLDEFKIEDGSENCLFKNIVSPKINVSKDLEVTQEPLVDFFFENNPLDRDVDSRVSLKLLGTTIYYNVYFLTSILKFFQPQKQHLETINKIINVTEETVEGWSTHTRMGIESLLEEHKTLDLYLDLEAPLIIIPTSPKNWDSPCTIIDTGHISVNSDVISKNKLEELKKLSVDEYDKIDSEDINRLMFDRFLIISQDTKFLVGPTIQSTLASLSNSVSDNDFCILDKMKLEVTFDLLILSKAYKLPKSRIYGHLPQLNISFNDLQYKIMMDLLQNLIPQTDSNISEDIITSYQNIDDEDFYKLDQKRLSDTLDTINKMTNLQIEQKQIEISLKIDSITFSVLKCIDTTSMRCDKLVNLIGDNVNFNLSKTLKDIKLQVGVHDLHLEDLIENINVKEFKYLISSNSVAQSEDKNLFNLVYIRSQRIVMHEKSYIEVFDQDIDISLKKLMITLTPKSILTLLNYVVSTFNNPQEGIPADILKHNSEDKDDSPQKINMKVAIDGILIYLNDNNDKIATFDILSGTFKMLLLPTNMRMSSTIDGLELHDNISSTNSYVPSKIITMNGKQLLKFSYETYDPETNNNNFDSLFECETGEAFINFNSATINKIIIFFYKFQKMKTYFDRIRQAAYEQAPSLDTVKNLKVSAIIRSPVIQFFYVNENKPTIPNIIKFYLGEFFINNNFILNKSGTTINHINAGLRDGQISSLLQVGDGRKQKLYLADKMNLTFNINHNPEATGFEKDFEIFGCLEELNLNVTELQMKYLYSIYETIEQTFNIPNIYERALTPEIDITANTGFSNDSSLYIDNMPAVNSNVSTEESGKVISVNWEGPLVSLTLYDDTKNVLEVSACSITKVILQDMKISYSTNRNQTFVGKAHISAFRIEDTRNVKDNKFKELIPKLDGEENQFIATITRKWINDGLLTNLSVSVNSPRFILAMDHLIALKKFFDILSVPKSTLQPSKELLLEHVATTEELNDTPKNLFHYSLKILDSAILLLLDPSDLNTEAIVFSVGQILLTEQSISTLTINNIGIFLTKMNMIEEQKIRLLDDFSSSITVDKRNTSKSNLATQVQVAVEPIRMRISLRDIRLAMLIFDRAVSLLNTYSKQLAPFSNKSDEKTAIFSKEFEKQLVKYVPSLTGDDPVTPSDLSSIETSLSIQLRNEIFSAHFGGFRVILLGDIHEIPILDARIHPFVVNAKDWSTEFDAITTVTSSVNIFNYSRSSWEPLIEKTNVAFHLAKNVQAKSNSTLLIDVTTEANTEITLSSRSITTLLNIPASLSGEIKLKPRGFKKPYRLINDTGVDIEVWVKGDSDKEKDRLTLLKMGEVLPWEFEDWQSIREQLDTDNKKNVLQASVKGDIYNTIMTIDATYEGEVLHVLKPAKNGIHRRIICDLKSTVEGIKEINFRSTLAIENSTSSTIEIKVESEKINNPVFLVIKEQECKSVPLEYVYDCNLFVKPKTHGEFDWSSKPILWEKLLEAPCSVECHGIAEYEEKFYFELKALYDKKEPLARIYPHMKIIISPPLVIENLLPFDMNYRVFSRREDSKKESFLKKGETVLIHSVSLDEFLLLSVRPHVDGNPMSKPSIVNTPTRTSLEPEEILPLTFESGQRLNLRVKYHKQEDGRSRTLKIYSPYIILNGTGKDLYIEEENFNVVQSRVLLEEDSIYSQPLMFSFMDNSNKNRVRIKFMHTEKSVRLSLDAIGQVFDVTLNVTNKSQECNLGVSITEGDGPYHLSKMIYITPRYMIKNDLNFTINVSELGSPDVIDIEPNKTIPLYNLQNNSNKQLMIKALGNTSEWSAPFYIKDVGLTYVRLLREAGTHILLKLEITLQDATLFISIKNGMNLWPYSIRNFSDNEFIFYQRDFRIIDEQYNKSQEEDPYESPEIEYKPIYYRIPPRSVMPYAWDYPTAKQKKLILNSKGRRREVQLAEIGNLKPMRIPGETSNGRPIIVDLSVVADGPTQALLITNYDPKVSLYKLRERRSTSTDILTQSSTSLLTPNDIFETKEEDELLFTKIIVNVKGLGISLVNSHLQELMYVNINGIELRYNDSELYRTLSWKLKWLQIDNQLFGTNFTNVLYPANIPKDNKELEIHPVISGSVSKVKDDSFGIPYFKHATFLLQEFSIQLDEEFIYAVLDFIKFPSAAGNHNNHGKIAETRDDKVLMPTLIKKSFANDIYFELFHIQPTQLHISFVRSERLQQEGDGSIEIPEFTTALSSMYFLNILSMAVGNVNDAPIKLNSLLLNNSRVPIAMLYDLIKTHYGQQFIYQIHMILGSADFLGNPVGLFNTISSGVWDLFYEPYQGYMLNDRPQELGLHIAKGGLSFAQKTVYGISDSMTKFTGSMAKGLSVTQDREFQEARRLQKRIVNNGGNVLGNSATSFLSTVGSGIAGLAMDPLRGGQREGTTGFFKGIGKGLVGLPTKTAIGILDLTSNLSQGVKKSTSTLAGGMSASRARLPRHIDLYEQVINSYNLRESQGQFWLKTCNGGLFINDHYLAHVILPGRELAVIVSMERICEVRIAPLECMWGTSYNSIQGISVESDGIRIKLKMQSEYFIPIEIPAEKKYLYRHIKIAVLEYNKYCEATL